MYRDPGSPFRISFTHTPHSRLLRTPYADPEKEGSELEIFLVDEPKKFVRVAQQRKGQINRFVNGGVVPAEETPTDPTGRVCTWVGGQRSRTTVRWGKCSDERDTQYERISAAAVRPG